MRLCDVIGPVVSTVKHPAYHGLTLLAVQPVDAEGTSTGPSFLAVDRVQSGAGDRVLVMSEGNGVRQLFGEKIFPVRSVIVAIVDQIDVVYSGKLDDMDGAQ
jgi:microcompartment protein CcmK/EutM